MNGKVTIRTDPTANSACFFLWFICVFCCKKGESVANILCCGTPHLFSYVGENQKIKIKINIFGFIVLHNME